MEIIKITQSLETKEMTQQMVLQFNINILGYEGFDTVDYTNNLYSIVVNMSENKIYTPFFQEVDTIFNIE